MTSRPEPVPVTVTEVDGVPTVWAPVAGPLRATLLLRVGVSDETLLTHGITHLLEHLALFGVGRPGDHSNGSVAATHTLFHAVGDDESVTTFLAAATRQLADPPVHRLDDERGVLAAEHAGRRRNIWDQHLLWRYGATGYGVAGHEPFGERRVDAAALTAWSHRYATRGNAVLWLSGPPPAGIRLHLPDGERIPARDPRETIVSRYPAWFTGPDDSASLDAIVPRGVATSVLAYVLRSRLVDDLRSRRALAYSPDADGIRVTGDVVRLMAHTDLVPGRQSEGVRPFVEALEELADPGAPGAVRAEDVAAWNRIRRQHALEPGYGLAWLDGAAWDLLHGRPPQTPAEVEAEADALTPADVTTAARQALESALAQVPVGLAPRHEPWRPAPASDYAALTGRDYASRKGGADAGTMTVADAGLTMRVGDAHRTVPLAQTVAVLRRPDGGRVLVAADGNQLDVEPTLWHDGDDLVRRIDAAWPPDLVIDLGPRPPDAIPAPDAVPAPVEAPRGTPARYAPGRARPRWSGLRLRERLALAALVAIVVAIVVMSVIEGRMPPLVPLLVGLGVSIWFARKERASRPDEIAERPQDRTAGREWNPGGDRGNDPEPDVSVSARDPQPRTQIAE
jgi:zinc protease